MNNWLELTEARSLDVVLINFDQVYLIKPVKDKDQCLLYFSAESSHSQVMTVAASMSTLQAMIAEGKR
jgi:hypothetical protein